MKTKRKFTNGNSGGKYIIGGVFQFNIKVIYECRQTLQSMGLSVTSHMEKVMKWVAYGKQQGVNFL